jgi:hypothetical protein
LRRILILTSTTLQFRLVRTNLKKSWMVRVLLNWAVAVVAVAVAVAFVVVVAVVVVVVVPQLCVIPVF